MYSTPRYVHEMKPIYDKAKIKGVHVRVCECMRTNKRVGEDNEC